MEGGQPAEHVKLGSYILQKGLLLMLEAFTWSKPMIIAVVLRRQ